MSLSFLFTIIMMLVKDTFRAKRLVPGAQAHAGNGVVLGGEQLEVPLTVWTAADLATSHSGCLVDFLGPSMQYRVPQLPPKNYA
jgi:hypothetical protein